MTTHLTNEFSSDRLCRACGGAGVIREGDPERPFDSVADSYCDCQRPILDADKDSQQVKRTQHEADRDWADRMMGSEPWFARLTEEERNEAAERALVDESIKIDGFDVFEMVGVRDSWKYRAPKVPARPFRDDFDIGQASVVRIKLDIEERALRQAAATILDTGPMTTRGRQSASRLFKAGIGTYRRAIAVREALNRPATASLAAE